MSAQIPENVLKCLGFAAPKEKNGIEMVEVDASMITAGRSDYKLVVYNVSAKNQKEIEKIVRGDLRIHKGYERSGFVDMDLDDFDPEQELMLEVTVPKPMAAALQRGMKNLKKFADGHNMYAQLYTLLTRLEKHPNVERYEITDTF